MLIKKRAFKEGIEFNRVIFKPEMSTMCGEYGCKTDKRVFHDNLCDICTNVNKRIAIWKDNTVEQFCFIPSKLY